MTAIDDLPGARDAKFLVTGGAGFIGSNIVEQLVAVGARVRVLDDLSSGHRTNLKEACPDNPVEIVEGDIRILEALRKAMSGMDFVLHQAAIPSVPRSVESPIPTHEANASGTLNVLVAARDAGVKRVVIASSSSVYGETPTLPKEESLPTSPLSPYAVSKLAAEQYARVFHNVYGLGAVALRYFNVFGPRQDPRSQYAAVIPNFVRNALAGDPLKIYGDGEQTRDFTFVTNVVRANVAACFAPNAPGTIVNIAGGAKISVRRLAETIVSLTQSRSTIVHEPARKGDIKHSHASIALAKEILGFEPQVDLEEGLRQTIAWYRLGTSALLSPARASDLRS